MFSIKDDLMASPKVIFFIFTLLPQPWGCAPPPPHTSAALPSMHLTHPLPPPHHRDVLQVQPTTAGEPRFQSETSAPDHHKLEPFPPWKIVSCCKWKADSFLELRNFFFFKAFYTYLRVRVRAPRVRRGICAHRCTRIFLSNINILYVRAVNIPWSCVYVFFKVSYPQCYVNNSIYWLMKLCVDLYPPDIVYVALSSQIKYKTTTSWSSSPFCSMLNIQL